jgi:Domain of unknown function (DUF6378)
MSINDLEAARGNYNTIYDRNNSQQAIDNWDAIREARNAQILAEQQAGKQQSTEAILAERGSRYGNFRDNARCSQALSEVFMEENRRRYSDRNQNSLERHQLEAIQMIFHKIARIVSGDDPSYADNWDDIAGYAQLGKAPR